MSDNNEYSLWSIVPLWLRLIIFVGLLIVAAPFLLIGHSKNTSIERAMHRGAESLEKGDFLDARKEYEKAGDSFGFLYDCYKLALNVTGGTYYKKNVCFMMRGVARTGAIAQKMGGGDSDVEAEIAATRKDLAITADIPANLDKFRQVTIEQLDMIEKLQPMVALCKDGKYVEAMKGMDALANANVAPFGEMVGMTTCYILSECAVNLKTPKVIKAAKVVCQLHSEKFKYPMYQQFAFKVGSLSAENVAANPAPAKASKPPADSKERFKLAMSLASKKDFQKALPLFETCYKENPKNVDFVYFFALAQSKAGKMGVAKKLCQEVLTLKPDHKGANTLLGAN